MNRSHRYLLLLALALASTSTPAFAVVKNWVGTSADWNLGANWTPTGVPGPADDAVFPGGSYTITYTPFNGWTETAQTLAFNGAGNISFGYIGPTPGFINVANSISQNGSAFVSIQPDIICGNAPGDPFTLDGTGPGLVRIRGSFLGVPNLTVNGGDYGIGGGGSLSGITLDRITVNAGTLEIGISNAVVVNNPVVVNGGTLRLCTVVSIFGATFTAPSVTVNAGGGFFANAPINSSITMNVGSILSPGCSPGTMAVSGNVTLAPGSSSNFELAAPAGPNDRIDVTGDLNLGGTLNVAGLPGFGVGVYRLFDYTGILSGPGLTLGSMPSGFSYAINTATLGQVDLMVTPAAPAGPICLIDTNMTWRYLDNGSDQGTTWKAPAFNDSGWSNGLPLFGVDTFSYPWPFRTPMPIGTNRITYYFRKHFSLSGSPAGVVLTVSGYHDDGAVYYLNGVEAARVRIAAGPVLYNTLAINLAPEGVLDTFTLSSASLQTGDNVLAVEVHQTSLNSSDIVFGMTLKAAVPGPTITVIAKPGFNLISNPLNGTNNLLDTILPGMPLESQVLLWNSALQTFGDALISDGTAWLSSVTGEPATESVNPGEGFFFFNPGAMDITINFRGQLVFGQPPIPATILRGGYVLLSRRDVGPGTFANIVGLPPEEGCQFLTFNAATQNYSTNTFSGGSWSLGAPALAVAQSAFVYFPLDTNPPVLLSASVNCLSNQLTLTFNEPLDSFDAEDVANYAISGGATVFGAVLSANGLSVSLTVGPLVAGTSYTVMMSGLRDLAGNTIAPGTSSMVACPGLPVITQHPASATVIAFRPVTFQVTAFNEPARRVLTGVTREGPAPAPGQFQPAADGDPVPGIDVKLGKNPGGQLVAQTTSGGDGSFSFSGIRPGEYLLTTTATGAAPACVTLAAADPASVQVTGMGLLCNPVPIVAHPEANPPTYQWHRDGSPMPGATNDTLTLASAVLSDNGATFSVMVSGPGGSVTSQTATLSVMPDTTPPTLVRVRADCASNKVTVVFSERMGAGSAAEPSNYQISGGVNVLSAMLGADGRSVCLFVDALTSGVTYTLDVYSATDLEGNSLSPDPSQRDFSCYTGPVITSVWPLTAQMGDIITIEGTGFSPVRANNSVARIGIEEDGVKVFEDSLQVIKASSNQLQVLVGPIPQGLWAGPIGVAVGTGVEAATIVGEVTTGNNLRLVKVPWLGQVGEAGPEGVLGSLSLRPEDATGILGTNGVDGQIFSTPTGLGWEPLPPLWTFTTTSEPALSSQEITLIPTPAPPTGTTWVFNEPVANGSISFVISNECPALTKVQIQCDWTVTGSNGLGMDIIIPNLILHARLPAAACAQAICDVIAGAYAQAGVQILCTVTNVGTNAARLTITVPGGSISDGTGVICFSPAEAGRSAPFISSIICPEDGQHDDWITITGGNFGNNPDDLCVQLMNGSSTVPLRVLYAQDDRILAQFGLVPSNAVPGRIGLVRGIGGPRSIVDPADGQHDDIIISPQPAWVFASTQPGVMSADIITPIPTPPPAVPGLGQPMKKRFYSEAVNSNGVMCLVVDTNCPPGTKITIGAHFGLVDFNTNDNVKCPLLHIDTLLENSEMQSTTFTNGNCVEFICRFFEQAFYNSHNTQFGGCFGYPIVCSADLQTGKITLSANPDCGCKLVGGSVSVELCIPPQGGTTAPVITSISTNILHTGAIINIIGSGFGQNPDNVCAVVVNTNRLIPLRVLDATDTLLTLEVGPIPPGATPGRIGLAIGHGSVGQFQPALPGLAPQPAWFLTSTNGGVMSPFTVTPIHVPPVSQVWYHSFLSNGQIYVFLPGPCPPGTKLTMDGHFNIQSTNSPIRHADCWLPVVNYPQGGSAIECARRVCDSFVCGFLQRTGVRLNCSVIPVGNGALVCLGYPGGTIVNGGMTVCVRICDEPPAAACVSNVVASFGHGGPSDNFAGAQGASIRPEMLAWLASGGITSTRGYDDFGLVNRSFADSFSNLPDCITKATLRIRLRANRDIERNDTIMLAFAGTGGVLDPNRWSSYIGTGNPGPGVLNYTWLATNVAELVLDLGRLPLGNNQFKDLIPTLCAKRYLDLYVQDDTSVDYAILSIESCRCRQDIVLCAPPGQPCAPVTYATPTFTDLCCPNIPGSLRVTCTPASGTCFPIGTNSVHCTAIDAAGRRARCCFQVIVLQGTPPVFATCPASITTNSAGASVVVTYANPTVTGGTLIGCTPASGSTFALGTNLVTCLATNVCGSSNCTFIVTVSPSGPSFRCPDNVVRYTPSPVGMPVRYTTQLPDDLTNGQVTCEPPAGALFSLGTTPVTCQLTVTGQVVRTCTFNVSVLPSDGSTNAPANLAVLSIQATNHADLGQRPSLVPVVVLQTNIVWWVNDEFGELEGRGTLALSNSPVQPTNGLLFAGPAGLDRAGRRGSTQRTGTGWDLLFFSSDSAVTSESSQDDPSVRTPDELPLECTFISFDTPNLIAGEVLGEAGQVLFSVPTTENPELGPLTFERVSAGVYDLALPGKSAEMGQLFLNALAASEVSSNTSPRTLLSHEYSNGVFRVYARQLIPTQNGFDPNAPLRDTDFTFAFVDYASTATPGGGFLGDEPGLVAAVSSPGTLTLAWPVVAADQFTLQCAANLSAQAWTNVTLATQTNGGVVSVVVPTTQVQAYYRLLGTEPPGCTNGGLEMGTLMGWRGWIGTTANPAQTEAITPGRHTIMNAGGFDPKVGGSILPVVFRGSKSVRLGNSSVGKEAERLSFTFTVSPQNKLFTFSYAVVVEDPKHAEADQPYFSYRVYHGTPTVPGGVIKSLFKRAKTSDPYFKKGPGSILYKEWDCEQIDLSASCQIGDVVTIDFTTADCNQGAHFGYAYIDGVCQPPDDTLQLSFTMPSMICEGQTVVANATATTGETDYFWSIEESDAFWGRKPWTEVSEWFPASQAGIIDLSAWYAGKGRKFECGRYYRVKLAAKNTCLGWKELTRLLYVKCGPNIRMVSQIYLCCCTSNQITLGPPNGPQAGVQYMWTSKPPGFTSAIANPVITVTNCDITYTLKATDQSGCMSTLSTRVRTLGDFDVQLVAQTLDCAGHVRLVPKINFHKCPHCFGDVDWRGVPINYLWNTGATTPTTDIKLPGSAFNFVVVSTPCETHVATITVAIPAYLPAGAFPPIQCPNVFTPNGDGVNDYWYARDLSKPVGFKPSYNAFRYRFEVYNRWGTQRYFDADKTDCTGFANCTIPYWNGSGLNDGVYYHLFYLQNLTSGLQPVCVGFTHIFH